MTVLLRSSASHSESALPARPKSGADRIRLTGPAAILIPSGLEAAAFYQAINQKQDEGANERRDPPQMQHNPSRELSTALPRTKIRRSCRLYPVGIGGKYRT